MADYNLRQWILDALKPLLPKTWQYVSYGALLDTITRPTFLLDLQTVEKDPDAWRSHRLITYNLWIIQPTNQTESEADNDSLDDDLIDLLNAIDASPDLQWSTAERTNYVTTNPAFRITFTHSIAKEFN